jgi:predicted GIY-YIG superfamily endonuclease
MVYLIHFDKKLHHAQHYLGFCDGVGNLESRIAYHREGRGAKILKAVAEAGISFKVVRTWDDGDRNFERMLKNRKKARILCPICNKKH